MSDFPIGQDPLQETELPQSQGDTNAHELVIDVLGARIAISAGEDPAYLEEVLAQYQFAVANTHNISGLTDPLEVAILTGFLLCDEINKLKQQVQADQASAEKELSRITQSLTTSIDQILVREIHSIHD